MRVEILRSPDETQRRERADDEDKNSDPERPRRRGVPVRLDGRDDGLNAGLRQPEAAVPPVSGPEVQEAATVRARMRAADHGDRENARARESENDLALEPPPAGRLAP